LPFGKPLLSEDTASGRSVEDLQLVVRETKKYLEQAVEDLKRVAKKVE